MTVQDFFLLFFRKRILSLILICKGYGIILRHSLYLPLFSIHKATVLLEYRIGKAVSRHETKQDKHHAGKTFGATLKIFNNPEEPDTYSKSDDSRYFQQPAFSAHINEII